jgi:hypothetical protein
MLQLYIENINMHTGNYQEFTFNKQNLVDHFKI